MDHIISCHELIYSIWLAVEITIHEGRNHQVRKMFESLGYQVLKLKREKYANLDLKGLKPGEYRKLSNKEIAVLYSMVK